MQRRAPRREANLMRGDLFVEMNRSTNRRDTVRLQAAPRSDKNPRAEIERFRASSRQSRSH
jgi:hypothetical protein